MKVHHHGCMLMEKAFGKILRLLHYQEENFLREQTIMLHLEVTDMRLLMMAGSMIKIIKKSKKKMTNHSLYLLTKKVTAHTQESPTVNVKQQLIGGKKILINGKW